MKINLIRIYTVALILLWLSTCFLIALGFVEKIIRFFFPCENFGCIGNGVIYLIVLCTLPFLLTTIAFLLFKNTQISFSKIQLFISLLIMSSICIAGSTFINLNAKKTENKKHLITYYEEKKQEFIRQGIDQAQILQETHGPLDRKRLISILQTPWKDVLIQNYPSFPQYIFNKITFESNTHSKKQIEEIFAIIQDDFLINPSENIGAKIKIIYFQNGSKIEEFIGEAQIVEKIANSNKTIVSFNLNTSNLKKPFFLVFVAKGNVFESLEIP